MKCPNCRCIVPNNVSRCTYCGYDFMSGEARTLTIEEAYAFRAYDYNYGDYSEEFDTYVDDFDYQNYENYEIGDVSVYSRETDGNNFVVMISAIMLLAAALLLLGVIAIII